MHRRVKKKRSGKKKELIASAPAATGWWRWRRGMRRSLSLFSFFLYSLLLLSPSRCVCNKVRLCHCYTSVDAFHNQQRHCSPSFQNTRPFLRFPSSFARIFYSIFLSSSCLFTMAETFVVAAAVILPAHVTEKKKKGESKKRKKGKKGTSKKWRSQKRNKYNRHQKMIWERQWLVNDPVSSLKSPPFSAFSLQSSLHHHGQTIL